MSALLRAEARKLAATRSAIALAGLAVSYGVLAVGMAALLSRTQRVEIDADTILQILRGVSDLAAPVAAVLGIMATAGEFRHGTIVPALLAAPRRPRFFGAKLVSQAVLGGTIGAVGSAVSLAAGLAFISGQGAELDRPLGDLVLTMLGVVAVVAIYGALGASLGALVRNQTAAVTIALVWMLAIEEIVPSLLRSPGLRRWLLDGAGTRLLHVVEPHPSMPDLWAAVLVLVAAIGLLAIPAVVRTARSDIQ